jgi:heterodisulfide reductase subunit B
MKIGYYPGCSLLGTACEFDESFRAIAPGIGLELVEVPDWNCCGASAAHNLNHELSLALPARVLALAEGAGMKEIVVPCSACFNRLAMARHELLQKEELRKKISSIIEMKFHGRTEVKNVLEVLTKIFEEGIEDKIKKPFDRAVACYYGCLIVRPPKVMQFDRYEDPQSMDELMKKIGAEPIDWAFKVECCGAGLSISRTDLVAKLSSRIIEDAVRRGAEAIIVACPMCHANLDMRQEKVDRLKGKKYSIPVLYLTQAIGLALGMDEKKLALHRHMVPVVFKPKPPKKDKPEAKKKGKKEEKAQAAQE